jgi:hypothetical protein
MTPENRIVIFMQYFALHRLNYFFRVIHFPVKRTVAWRLKGRIVERPLLINGYAYLAVSFPMQREGMRQI